MVEDIQSKEYQKLNADNQPTNLAIRLNNYLNKGMSIVDVGCGAGTDSIYFIERGCFVTAIDKETTIIEHRKLDLKQNIKDKLNVINADFTNIKLPVCGAVYASLSLPFCAPNNFNKFWTNLEQSLSKEGIFAGNFFGVNDDWYHTSANITFHRTDEIKELFKEFVIKEFEEKEFEGTYVTKQGNITNKHWHIYEIIAIKHSK